MNKTTLRKTINWSLIPLFLLILWSGIKLHVTDFVLDHQKWHNFSIIHCVAGFLMVIALIMHVQQHWAFYKSLLKPIKARKAKLRRAGVIVMTILFIIIILTGLWMLFFTEGSHTGLGIAHFWIGNIASLFVIKHVLKRHKSFEIKR